MYLVLFAVGLLVTAAGLLTIGFGIPINAFSLGNTLIISGTVAVVGGLVLIGLAFAIRQLNRIAAALNARAVTRSAPTHALAPAAEADTLVPPTARMPQAPVRSPPKAAEPVVPRSAVEPRFPAATAEQPSGPLDWLRAKKTGGEAPPVTAEPPVMDVSDEAPLSPRPPQRPMFTSPVPPAPSVEPPVEPKVWTPPNRGNGEPRPDFPPISAPRAESLPRAAQPERARDPGRDAGKPAGKDAGLFDVVWPDARAKTAPAAEPREPKFESKPEPARPEPRPEKRAEIPASERPAAILKSGVIDGMAYTLYADGSIEAELPQGVVRFASVDALRAHLEKSV